MSGPGTFIRSNGTQAEVFYENGVVLCAQLSVNLLFFGSEFGLEVRRLIAMSYSIPVANVLRNKCCSGSPLFDIGYFKERARSYVLFVDDFSPTNCKPHLRTPKLVCAADTVLNGSPLLRGKLFSAGRERRKCLFH